ncbi:DNA-3-methyladenine glycosylase II [Nitzschia inconspicua]|uniref:DNA-3-methyladenine glycosylase II n=1 Tax=Nitzschia inconspicua TaxID=303405 RepID=A0A9K3PTS6_9STRA|nr:DNA-3-methyladenine glycosylase II [Nitzschia inconspicua]
MRSFRFGGAIIKSLLLGGYKNQSSLLPHNNILPLQAMSTVGQKRRLVAIVDDKLLQEVVDQIFERSSSCVSTRTKSGWCLREGLTHIMTVDNGRMMPIIQKHGLPLIYETTTSSSIQQTTTTTCRHSVKVDKELPTDSSINENLDEWQKNQPQNCFQSLCRIIAGQQLAGAAAKTVWNRLQETTGYNLTPTTIVNLAEQGMEVHLQKPAGLSAAKARSIVALAKAFQKETSSDINKNTVNDNNDIPNLSDEFLTTEPDFRVRETLLRVKGVGPWSCDMFMMFYLERPDILPVGDLGVRKGIAKLFQLRGNAKGGSLCPKKDRQLIETTLAPYRPYQSLVAYYMWRVADTKDVYHVDAALVDDTNPKAKKRVKTSPNNTKHLAPSASAATTTTPNSRRSRTITKQVTP